MVFKSDWEKTQTHFNVSTSFIKKMIHLASPDKTLESSHMISGGCAHLNFKICLKEKRNPFLLRLYRRDPAAAYREQYFGNLLKSQVPIPQIYYIGHYRECYFALAEFMPGVPLRDILFDLSPYALHEIMIKVGNVLAKIISHPLPKDDFFDDHFANKSLENQKTFQILRKNF